MNDVVQQDPPSEAEFIVPYIEEEKAAAKAAADAKPKQKDDKPAKARGPVDDDEDTGAATPDEAEEPADPKPKPKTSEEARSNYELRKLRRELQELKESLSAAKDKETAAKPIEAPKRPRPSEYALGIDDDRYIEALEKYDLANQDFVLKRAEAIAEEKYRAQAQRVEQELDNKRFAEKASQIESKGLDKYEDFGNVVSDAFTAMPVDLQALRALSNLDGAEDVLYHLATNPAKLEKIANMSPTGQALEFGRLASQMSKASQSRPVSQARATPRVAPGSSEPVINGTDALYSRMLSKVNNRY